MFGVTYAQRSQGTIETFLLRKFRFDMDGGLKKEPKNKEKKELEQISEDSIHSSKIELPRRRRLLCSYRLLISVGAFFGFFNATLIRIGIVMAMVCMSKPHSRNVSEEEEEEGCPPLLEQDEHETLHEFDWSSKLQGFLVSGAFYGFLIGPFVSGFLSYRFGGKIILVIGTFCAGLTHVLIPVLTRVNPYFFFGVRVLSGFFGGFLFPATFDILSHWAIPEERQILVGGALIGVPLCSVVNFPLNGLLCNFFGWVWIFYFSSIWLSICCIFVYFFMFDSPQRCRYISSGERDYIVSQTPGPAKGKKVPWAKILRSVPIHAYIITHFCINYGFLTVILHLPLFMREVHHFRLKNNSLLSAAPYVASVCCRILMTYTFDRTKTKLKVSTNFLRKTYLTVGVFISSCALIAVAFIPCKYRYLALACFIIFAFTLEMSLSGGYLLSLLDMCPSYNNILSGIANAVANSAGLLTSLITGFFTPNGTHEEWNIVFFVSIGFFVIAGFSYFFFGSNELQPWGLVHPDSEREGRKSVAHSLVSVA